MAGFGSGTVGKQALSGAWKLAPDPDNRGREERWFEAARPEAQDAPVPGIIQQVFPNTHGVAWYWHAFRPARAPQPGERCLLRFGAVDYLAEVWLNGQPVGGHEGGETPFALDVTDALRPDGENLLAVRVLNPTETPIDGYVLAETPHRNKAVSAYQPGMSYNYGGILLPVELLVVPPVRAADVFARPEVATGQIRVAVTVHSDQPEAVRGALTINAAEGSGEVLDSALLGTEFAPGDSVHEVALAFPQPRLWSLDDPYLYRVEARLETTGAPGWRHSHAARCGFRDFRVVNGYFQLNRRRVFLRSTHTGNHFPIGQVVPHNPDLLRRDLIYAKASGFNMVRFIAGVAWPEQLDFCDEMGLMVYEETLAGWCLADSPKMGERFDRSLREMVLRDRNHPSVTIWGLLNETPDGPVFRHAVESLSLVRSLDDTRLVLLGSGRWDCQPGIGSVSNPGSSKWEHEWGIEAPGAPAVSSAWDGMHGGYFDRAGDAHVYPSTPHPPGTLQFLRALGRDTKPVFLSEYGIGSLPNVVHSARVYEQVGARLDLPDAALLRSMAEKLAGDWRRFGMDGVYPFLEDFLQDSQRLHARQRLLGFDLIRSNPKICGFNLTGMLDHGITGEGLWGFWREWKPGIVDALADGWAPLRWCLFAEPAHGYLGRPLAVAAVLANEDVLGPGEYPVRFRLSGPTGVAWEKAGHVLIPEPGEDGYGPLAAPALSEQVRISGPAGEYQLAASMEKGGSPTGGRLKLHLSEAPPSLRVEVPVMLWGIEPGAEAWLRARGVACRQFQTGAPERPAAILVGTPPGAGEGVGEWKELVRRVARGSCAIFLSPQAFRRGDDALFWLPLANKGRCYEFNDWLYHKECVAKRHPAFEGLQAGGIMDWDYYGVVIPHALFDGQETPEEVIAAAFAVGYCCPGGYASGVLLGAYPFVAGRFFVNTLRILENLDRHPAADRLLLNLARYAARSVRVAPTLLPGDFEGRLRAIGYAR